MTVSLDSLDDAVFGAMNGIDFPVARVLDGIDAALEAGLAPVKVNMVVRRGVNETSVVPMARWARETGVILRFIEYMDVGHSNGWRLDEVVPAADLVETLAAELAGASRRTPRTAARSPDRWRYLDGGGEFGVISSVTSPFCGDCTRARLSADGKLYTCLFAVDGHDVRAVLRGRGDRCGAGRLPRGRSGPARGDRYSELRSATTSTPPEGRDVRDGRVRSGVEPAARPSTACPQRRASSWIRIRPFGRDLVDNRVDPSTASARTVGLARRGRQERRTRDRIKDLRSAAGRFGRFVARLGWLSHHGPPAGSRPTGRDRHPGVDTSVGRTKPAGLGRLPPGRVPGGPHVRPAAPARRRSTPRSDPADPAERRSRPDCAALEAAVRERTDLVPDVGIVLGSGLGGLADDLEDAVAIPFADLPGWPAATAPGHAGRLLLGRLGGTPGRHAPGPLPPL